MFKFLFLSAMALTLPNFAFAWTGGRDEKPACEVYPNLCNSTQVYQCATSQVAVAVKIEARGISETDGISYTSKTSLNFKGKKTNFSNGRFWLGELPKAWQTNSTPGWKYPTTNYGRKDHWTGTYWTPINREIKYGLGEGTYLVVLNGGRSVYATVERSDVVHRLPCKRAQ